MRREIGSFIEGRDFRRSVDCSICKIVQREIIEKRVHFLCSGREAISAAIIDIENKKSEISKVCLLPQYTCDTVIVPFAQKNWSIYYYPINKNMVIDLGKMREIIDNVSPSVILIHPYYGMELEQTSVQFFQQLVKSRNIVIIEDLTQALYFLNFPQWSNYRVVSLRKWFAIPDGGMVIAKERIDIVKEEEDKEYVHLRRQAQRLKSRYLLGSKEVKKDVFLQLNSRTEEMLDNKTTISKMSEYTLKEIEEIDVQAVLGVRQNNADYLDESLKSFTRILTTINIEKYAPLYYPVLVENRDSLQKFLSGNNIYTSVIWKKPRNIDCICNKDVEYIYDHILAIPCDQRYSLDDMKEIVYFIKKYEEENLEK